MTKRELIDRASLLTEINNGIKAGNYEEGYENYAHINSIDDTVECVRYADVITEQEIVKPYLDKIRTEIRKEAFTDVNNSKFIFVNHVEQIIDKYRAESEGVEE